jgi:hypothetical protein
MLTISWIHTQTLDEEYVMSFHADQERQNDNLTMDEIEEALCFDS